MKPIKMSVTRIGREEKELLCGEMTQREFYRFLVGISPSNDAVTLNELREIASSRTGRHHAGPYVIQWKKRMIYKDSKNKEDL